MAVSVFDMFKIGIGPSSSHTVGPMRAARRFLEGLREAGDLVRVTGLQVELFGSLGATGRGHGSDVAIVLGLLGESPETVDVDGVDEQLDRAQATKRLRLLGEHEIEFDFDRGIRLRRKVLPGHPNGMRFVASSGQGELAQRIYYSVGGGFVVDESQVGADRIVVDRSALPYPFASGKQLLAQCEEQGMSMSAVMRANERVWRGEDELDDGLAEIWEVMQRCVARGLRSEGVLPGGLRVTRRAPALHRRLLAAADSGAAADPMDALDWVNLWAIATNEENAARGRVVTAPTNGAAGIVPAVMHHFVARRGGDADGVARFLLTSAAIGIIYTLKASISGAEVGCQGEVGVACSMAAAGLAEALGGTPEQVENAAEIGMEHNLGLTCDPVGGLVQVPCIERNAMGAVKAINAARLALRGDGKHKISLDHVIETMRQTGADMKTKYKETSRGGLAVNVTEC